MHSPNSDFKVDRLLPIVKHNDLLSLSLRGGPTVKKGYVFTHIFVFTLTINLGYSVQKY